MFFAFRNLPIEAHWVQYHKVDNFKLSYKNGFIGTATVFLRFFYFFKVVERLQIFVDLLCDFVWFVIELTRTKFGYN